MCSSIPHLALYRPIFNRMPHAGEAFKIGRVKSEEGRICCGFDNEGILKVDHTLHLSLIPAAFRIA